MSNNRFCCDYSIWILNSKSKPCSVVSGLSAQSLIFVLKNGVYRTSIQWKPMPVSPTSANAALNYIKVILICWWNNLQLAICNVLKNNAYAYKLICKLPVPKTDTASVEKPSKQWTGKANNTLLYIESCRFTYKYIHNK